MAVIVLLIVIILICCCCCKKKKQLREIRNKFCSSRCWKKKDSCNKVKEAPAEINLKAVPNALDFTNNYNGS